jgi:hypothetical protein
LRQSIQFLSSDKQTRMFGAARRVALATTQTTRAGALASPSPFRLAAGPVRYLNVHEYISMELFKTHGIATPECYVADTPEEAEHIATTALNRRTCPTLRKRGLYSFVPFRDARSVSLLDHQVLCCLFIYHGDGCLKAEPFVNLNAWC